MIKYLNEEDIEMDVQVGPQEEIDVDAKPEEAAPTQSMNPVDIAKSAPENIPVAAVHSDDQNDAGNEEKLEFYVDARDVEKFADINEFTMIDALNAIIHCHEDAGMRADNLTVIVSESTAQYARNIEKHGGVYKFIREDAEDISVDVQVGPNGEDMQVEADPQEANPVDAVKRDYGSVVVAKQGDEFFTDVEDVQKCAELNCESVISTLNGIIRVNEADCDISAQNLRVVVNENTSEEFIEQLQESGVDIFFLNESIFRNTPARRMQKKIKKIVKDFLLDNGSDGVGYSLVYIGGENSKYDKGDSKTVLLGISPTISGSGSYSDGNNGYGSMQQYDKEGFRAAIKIIKDKNAKLIKVLEEELDKKVASVKVQGGRLDVTNIAVTFK